MPFVSSALQTVQGGTPVPTPAPDAAPIIDGVQIPPPEIPPLPPEAADAIAEVMRNLQHLDGLEQLEALRALQGLGQVEVQHFPEPIMHLPPELLPLVFGSLVLILLMVVGYPIARALARRIDRQTVASPPEALPQADVVARLERIEHAVETMAVEIERISEGQRFTNRLFSEQARGLGAGRGAPTAAEP